MTLFSPDGKPQPPIGSGDHWKLFERFQDGPLYPLLVAKIQDHLTDEAVNSGQLGSAILSQLQSEHPTEYVNHGYAELGSLFGMTLWNFLANLDKEWCFTRTAASRREYTSMYYFPREFLG